MRSRSFPKGSTEAREIAAYRPQRKDIGANCMIQGTVRSIMIDLPGGTLCHHGVVRQAAPSSSRAERHAVGHPRRRLQLVAFVPRVSMSCVGAARVPMTHPLHLRWTPPRPPHIYAQSHLVFVGAFSGRICFDVTMNVRIPCCPLPPGMPRMIADLRVQPVRWLRCTVLHCLVCACVSSQLGHRRPRQGCDPHLPSLRPVLNSRTPPLRPPAPTCCSSALGRFLISAG